MTFMNCFSLDCENAKQDVNREANQLEAFYRLSLLIEQKQFELVCEEGKCRLVYMMNDAVESFLVFQNYRIKGSYEPDFSGTPEIWLELGENHYLLAVRQGPDNVFTICFENLEVEDHFYNYGEIGHFWVKEYEYLRQLEYRLAILRDKCCYLGEEAASEEERFLAKMADFPPLQCYPAVPDRYRNIPDNPWHVELDTILEYRKLAARAGDRSLERILKRYEKKPSAGRAKKIARMLRRNAHGKTVDLLAEKLRQAAAIYPNRSFGRVQDAEYQKLWEMGKAEQERLRKADIHAELLREEPFVRARDSVTYQVYLMIWKKGLVNRRVTVRPLNKS